LLGGTQMRKQKQNIEKKDVREPDFWRTPLDIDKENVQKGEVHIIKDRCKACDFCIEFCPNNVLAISEEFNVKGYHPPYVLEPDNCVACKLCELICPEFAIYITEDNNLKTDKDEQ